MQPMAKTSAPKAGSKAGSKADRKADRTADPEAAPKRQYSSALRARQAADTKAQVLAAAAELFEETGWSGTTVAAIAKRAGVAVETVYSGVGSKKQVLRAVL